MKNTIIPFLLVSALCGVMAYEYLEYRDQKRKLRKVLLNTWEQEAEEKGEDFDREAVEDELRLYDFPALRKMYFHSKAYVTGRFAAARSSSEDEPSSANASDGEPSSAKATDDEQQA